MKPTKNSVLLLSVCLSFVLVLMPGCAKKELIIYEDSFIKISEVQPLNPVQYATFYWIDPHEAPVFELCDTVFKGKVTDIKEIELSYENGGSEVVDYSTLIVVTVTDVFYQEDELQPGSTIKIYSSLSSRDYPEDEVTELSVNREYIFFTSNLAKSEKNLLGLERIADYVLFYPKYLLLDCEDSGAKMDGVFTILENPINTIDSTLNEQFATSKNRDVPLLEEYIHAKSKEYSAYKNNK